jgi:hypothetical protein
MLPKNTKQDATQKSPKLERHTKTACSTAVCR